MSLLLPSAAAQPSATALADTLVLFDWNGTIVLDADRARDALNAVLGRRDLGGLDPVAFSGRFRLPMAGMFADLGVRDADLTTAEQEWNDAMGSTTTTLRTGTNATLATLAQSGARLGVISAASADAVDFDRRTLRVPDVFATVEAPVTDKLAALLAHRAERTHAFYVGDTAYDMRCAAAAGFVPVGVVGGYAPADTLRVAGAEHVIDSLAELPELLHAVECG